MASRSPPPRPWGPGAVLETHDALVLHTAGKTIRYPQHEPFATFHYYRFCQALLDQTDATVCQVRATGVSGNAVQTAHGPIEGRFIVDASGWTGLRKAEAGPARALRQVGYGIETELPGRHSPGPGLHFYFDRTHLPEGYAWAFPCGATTRLGLCSFQKGFRLGPALAWHLDRFGLQPGATHGGVLATGPVMPLVGDRFVVGDAAGQCLPMTGEGIRPALLFGQECGRLIAAALAGTITAAEARRRYAAQVRDKAHHRHNLRWMQRLVGGAPDSLSAVVGGLCSQPPVLRSMMAWYHDAGGGLPVSA